MAMRGLPQTAESGHAVEPIRSDELLKRSKAIYPVYAFGYNWLASNKEAAVSLRNRIMAVIAENNAGSMKCTQVILVTHSMGGLVARACSQLPDMSRKIVGVVHGVMPATGAPVAYRRCKVGMKDEDRLAGSVIGSDGQSVTAVFAQSPGALQLLPSSDYGMNWLDIRDASGKRIASLPSADPYDEIYLQKEKWWGLVREEWLSPSGGAPISWDEFESNIESARDFHIKLAKKYHERTYVFFGGGREPGSFSKICWNLKIGNRPDRHGPVSPISEATNWSHKELRTDGSNSLYVGGEHIVNTTLRGDSPVLVTRETSFWDVRCSNQDSSGDGTVPTRSGRAPRADGGQSILQQFELEGIQHEPAYKDYPLAQQVAYYAITKLAALADIS
jgi:pimeloyl-ACP methyl ester carboxylesterase